MVLVLSSQSAEILIAAMAPAGHVFNWVEFQAAFRAAYIPKPVMDLKRREFLELTQGRMDLATWRPPSEDTIR